MQITNLTAKPGTETNLIEQHGNSQFFHDNPKFNEFGEIETVRTGKVKNFLGSVGGTVGQGMFGLGIGEALAPHYSDKRIEAKEQAFLIADTIKGVAYQGISDPGALFLDTIDMMGMGLRPDELEHIRTALGVKTNRPPPKSTPPALITWLQKKTGRYDEDQITRRIQAYADENNISFDEAVAVYFAKEEIEGEYETVSGLADLSEDELHELGLEIDRSGEIPKELRDILQQNPYLETRPGLNPGSGTYAKWQRDKDAWDAKKKEEYFATQKRHELEYKRYLKQKKIEAQKEAQYKYEHSPQFAQDQKDLQMYLSTTTGPPPRRRGVVETPPAQPAAPPPRRRGVVETPAPPPPVPPRRRMGGEI
jgi:hypothetical protein